MMRMLKKLFAKPSEQKSTSKLDIAAAKRLLAGCEYDPEARRVYDIMRGGFVWDDELPSRHSVQQFAKAVLLLAQVIAYRASVTLGEPNPEYEPDWLQLQSAVPTWPGFREDRMRGQVERDLRAVKLREERCCRELEDNTEGQDK